MAKKKTKKEPIEIEIEEIDEDELADLEEEVSEEPIETELVPISENTWTLYTIMYPSLKEINKLLKIITKRNLIYYDYKFYEGFFIGDIILRFNSESHKNMFFFVIDIDESYCRTNLLFVLKWFIEKCSDVYSGLNQEQRSTYFKRDLRVMLGNRIYPE